MNVNKGKNQQARDKDKKDQHQHNDDGHSSNNDDVYFPNYVLRMQLATINGQFAREFINSVAYTCMADNKWPHICLNVNLHKSSPSPIVYIEPIIYGLHQSRQTSTTHCRSVSDSQWIWID